MADNLLGLYSVQALALGSLSFLYLGLLLMHEHSFGGINMQEEDKKDFNIIITVSDGNLTYSSEMDYQATVFWLRAVESMIINKALND